MWLFLPEYFLEDCIQMTQFVPPPKDKKKKDKEDDGGEDDDVSRFLHTPQEWEMFIVRVFDGEENKWLKHSMN